MDTFLLFTLLAILLGAGDALTINITIIESATAQGAVCLDGSPPAYYLDKGFDTGLSNWIIFLEGGGWCKSIPDCQNRVNSSHGSSTKMDSQVLFGGILHNTPQENPDFYNWNRVWVSYCDGSSFTGDVEEVDPENKLFFRGARVFRAVLEDLWSKGMQNAKNAILSGTSAGGLATILNCDKFKYILPNDANVKCVANAGFFINALTISGTPIIQETYHKVVTLHGSAKNLPPSCTSAMEPSLCFFPQHVVPYVETPLFIINSAYDYWQISNILVPKYLDPYGAWDHCKRLITFGLEFLKIFGGLIPCYTRGYFITSCHTHARIVQTSYWFNVTSPRIFNRTIAEAVGDWYMGRTGIHQHIDPYPFARDCW